MCMARCYDRGMGREKGLMVQGIVGEERVDMFSKITGFRINNETRRVETSL